MAAIDDLELYENLHTPCFIFDVNEFERSVSEFRNALNGCFETTEIGYSVKTNSLSNVLTKAHALGCMAEVVSFDEFCLAKKCGFGISRIIYNGPMKSRETFIEALVGGAIVNIETKRELEWLYDLPDDKIYKVGIRLNINVSKVSPEDADGENGNSRFGFSDETDEFSDAIKIISSKSNVLLSGLHIHRTVHSRNPDFYYNSIAYAMNIVEKYSLKLDYIDVGGGYFGRFPNKPTFYDYVSKFKEALGGSCLKDIKIIVEPGNALIASSFAFLSEVIDVKNVDKETVFVTTDGSRNDIDPFFKKSDYLKTLFRMSKTEKTVPLQIVSGCTCLEYDRLFCLRDAEALNVGDRVLYNNVGAYTLTLSPQFIRLWPKVYERNDGKYMQIKEASNVNVLIER